MGDSKNFKYTARSRDGVLYGSLITLAVASLGYAGYLLTSGPAGAGPRVAGLCAVVALLLGFVWWLGRIRLKLKVSEQGIRVKLKGWQLDRRREIGWAEIASCSVVRTPDAAKWHGAAIARPREDLYSLDGRTGLDVGLRGGGSVFIGCDDTDELSEAIARFNGR